MSLRRAKRLKWKVTSLWAGCFPAHWYGPAGAAGRGAGGLSQRSVGRSGRSFFPDQAMLPPPLEWRISTMQSSLHMLTSAFYSDGDWSKRDRTGWCLPSWWLSGCVRRELFGRSTHVVPGLVGCALWPPLPSAKWMMIKTLTAFLTKGFCK